MGILINVSIPAPIMCFICNVQSNWYGGTVCMDSGASITCSNQQRLVLAPSMPLSNYYLQLISSTGQILAQSCKYNVISNSPITGAYCKPAWILAIITILIACGVVIATVIFFYNYREHMKDARKSDKTKKKDNKGNGDKGSKESNYTKMKDDNGNTCPSKGKEYDTEAATWVIFFSVFGSGVVTSSIAIQNFYEQDPITIACNNQLSTSAIGFVTTIGACFAVGFKWKAAIASNWTLPQ